MEWETLVLVVACLVLVALPFAVSPGPLVADDPDEAKDEQGSEPTEARSCHLGGVCNVEGTATRLGKTRRFCSKCWRGW